MIFDKLIFKIKRYFKSFITKLSLIMGLLMYMTYAFKNNEWENTYLISISLFVGFFLPHYARISENLEKFFNLKTGTLTTGKISRFVAQLFFNFFILKVLLKGQIIFLNDLLLVGGIFGAASLTTVSSQGLQYLAIALSNRGMGDRFYNVSFALSFNIILSGLAALGFVNIQVIFIVLGLILGFIGIGYSVITDLMSLYAPKGGIGIFFGTFNPVHISHIKILEEFIDQKKLEVVYIHPTGIPKMHDKFLKDGIIEIKEYKNGMRVYQPTDKADIHVDYFPTGNIFYEVENRLAFLKECLKDYNLNDKIEAIFYEEEFNRGGFYEVIKKIKKENPKKRIHGLHGSDVGGILVRQIYDESFGIWPHPIVRRDNVSATAIRNGKKGFTSNSVTKLIDFLNDISNHGKEIEINGDTYHYINHRLFNIR